MADTVALFTVIHVLENCEGVTVSAVVGMVNTYVVEGDGVLEQITFNEQVSKPMLRSLARKLKIGIHLFWNPEVVTAKNTNPIKN